MLEEESGRGGEACFMVDLPGPCMGGGLRWAVGGVHVL